MQQWFPLDQLETANFFCFKKQKKMNNTEETPKRKTAKEKDKTDKQKI